MRNDYFDLVEIRKFHRKFHEMFLWLVKQNINIKNVQNFCSIHLFCNDSAIKSHRHDTISKMRQQIQHVHWTCFQQHVVDHLDHIIRIFVLTMMKNINNNIKNRIYRFEFNNDFKKIFTKSFHMQIELRKSFRSNHDSKMIVDDVDFIIYKTKRLIMFKNAKMNIIDLSIRFL